MSETNMNKNERLVNSCKYSFTDLINASGDEITTNKLYSMNMKDKNEKVKDMCRKAGWYWKDVSVNTEKGVLVYTSFSPLKE